MDDKKLFQAIKDRLHEILAQQNPQDRSIWHEFIAKHPADIAEFISELDRESSRLLFAALAKPVQNAVFSDLSYKMQASLLAHMNEQEQIEALRHMPVDELTDIFDHFSDEELKKYLTLLNKGVRQKVISLLKFHPESAGGIMNIDVLTLRQEFTVEKSISLLQRLRPRRDVHQQIFVLNQDDKLTGYIYLEDLVLQKPKETIAAFMHKNELVVDAYEDQETVAKDMVHYGLMMAPVVDKNNHFLGVISGETLVDVIVEEASEDIQKMSALTPMKYPYFETSFFRLLWERSYILVILLLAESFSSNILASFETSLNEFLLIFIPMLISVGGNTSNQTSAMVIQGMATGEIGFNNVHRFIRREFCMAIFLALILGGASFVRVWFTGGNLIESFAIGFSLSAIVLLAGIFGACLPFLLKWIRIDPAFSAGPFLATIMDIMGILIFCFLTKFFLF